MTTNHVLEDLGLRRPGRPKGSRNKNRVATADRINSEGDPIGFLCKVVRGGKLKAAAIGGAPSRTWCYPTIDQRTEAAVTLAKKVMPDLRPSEVGINIQGDGGVVLQVISGIHRLPTDPIDVTPTPPPTDNLEPQSTEESVTTSPEPDSTLLPPGRPRHPSSSPMDAPQPALPLSSDRLHDDNLCRESDDAKIAALNARASRFIA
jgi:hypothetical protein